MVLKRLEDRMKVVFVYETAEVEIAWMNRHRQDRWIDLEVAQRPKWRLTEPLALMLSSESKGTAALFVAGPIVLGEQVLAEVAVEVSPD